MLSSKIKDKKLSKYKRLPHSGHMHLYPCVYIYFLCCNCDETIFNNILCTL